MLAVFVATGVVAAVAFGPARPEGATIIRGTAIVDVEHGVLVRGKDIIVRGGVIEGVEPAGVVKAGEGDAEIAVAGLFALPGLFDAHVHLTASPETYPKLLVAHGVTAARDMGGPTELVLGLQESFAKAEQVGPDLFVTGAIIDGDPPVWPFSEPVDTPEEGRAAVRKLKEAGVDMIKVYSRLNKDVYEAVVDEAHKVGLKATGHIPESVTLAEAIAAGQDCNEHLMRVDVAIAALAGHQEERDRPLTRLMSGWAHFDEVPAEKLEGVARSIGAAGMVQCPTLIVTAGIGRADQDETLKDPQMAYVPSHMSAFWTGPGYRNWAPHAARVVPLMQKAVAVLHKGGVTLMVGTDLANPYVFAGRAVHDEMSLWQEAGIPPADILRAATMVPATFCGAADRLGSIAPGRTASIVLTRKDPLEDVRHAAEIEHVFLRGRHYDRAGLDGLLAEVRELVAASSPDAGEEPDAEEKLALPGEEVARGKFTFKFGEFPAGEEKYIITKSAEGFHMYCDNRPQGGGALPFTLTAHADEAGRIRTAVWKRRSGGPVEATYTLAGDELRVVAVQGGEEQPAQTIALGAGGVLSLPSIAGDFLIMRGLDLKPGDTRELSMLSFGFLDWHVQRSPCRMTRLEDGTIERDGQPATCIRYTSELKTQIGTFTTEAWLDAEYLPLRVRTTMPFGVLTGERE